MRSFEEIPARSFFRPLALPAVALLFFVLPSTGLRAVRATPARVCADTVAPAPILPRLVPPLPFPLNRFRYKDSSGRVRDLNGRLVEGC